jgi:heme/copper-type cytochrome/quinol oxidase subunit 1
MLVGVGPGSGLAYGGPGHPVARRTATEPAVTVVPVDTGRLLVAWLGLALGSLVIAGFFAMLAAFARTPAVRFLLSAEMFQLALTSHVTFAFTVWFVTFAGAVWTYVAWRANYPLSARASWVAFALATAGSAAMAVPAFLASGKAYLNDYLPVIDHPFFWWGLLLVTTGVSVQAAAYLMAAVRARAARRADARPTGSPEAIAMAVGAVSMLLATASVAVAWTRLDPGLHFGYSLRALFWGGGHILQFLHVVGMVSAWVVCLSVSLAVVFPAVRVLRLLLVVLVPFMVAAAGAYLVWRPEELLINHLVTILSFGGLGVAGVPMLLMGAVAVAGARRPLPWRSPLFSATVVSFAMFALGGVMGLIGFSQDTRVPAHYHGMVGAVTLAYMGLMPLLLDVCGRKPWSDRLSRWQPYLYGLGLLGLMIGMHWAGGHGAPRKTIGFTWANASAIVAMNIMGLGSVLAILGGLAFVVNMTVPLCRRRPRV